MSYTLSPNMSLRIPTIGDESGLNYTLDINFDLLSVLDTHDHTQGKGVQITPAAINVNTTLSLNNNFLDQIAGLTLLAQNVTPATTSTIYESGNDLYFVDGLGNNVRITQSGGIAGTPGSITNLTPPASVNYVSGSQTFVFQSNTATAANIDAGAYLFRNLSPNSTFAVTLSPPAGLSSNYDLILPMIPAQQSFMTLDTSGNMAAPWTVDNNTIKIISNQLVAQGNNIPNSAREHNWELNGTYASLTYPLLNIDAVFLAPYNVTINSVWIYSGVTGASGTTEYDLKVKSPGGAWTSILSITGKVIAGTTGIALVSSGTTATATLAGHGFNTGDSITVSGATQPNYNGTFTITVTSSSTFTYTMVGTAASPATGSPVVHTPGNEIYTDSGTVVTAQVGVTKPVLAILAILAGQAIKFDMLSSMTGAAQDARIRIYYTQT